MALRWMSTDLTDDKSTLVQVMAWSHQATSHYLSQCWPRSMSPYGVTRPQWVNSSLLSAANMSGNWVSIGSHNGMLPFWHQAITWTNDNLLSIGRLATIFSEIWIKTQTFSFMKMHLKMLSAKWWPFCSGRDDLIKGISRDCIDKFAQNITKEQ